jgi:nitronate monooxygenase
MPSKLAARLPWTTSPLIINAPVTTTHLSNKCSSTDIPQMAGSATAPLAIAVTRAGGLGQIGSANDLSALDGHITTAANELERTSEGLLPIGVGFLPFLVEIDEAMAVVGKHRPAVVWLFAAKQVDDYATWANRAREASPGSMVWVQVGSVRDAVRVVREAKPDVLVTQGADAGGHGLAKSAGLVSLLPEVRDTLAREGLLDDVMVVGSGGITDGRGAAAVFALGADGVVMGTRFLSASETNLHPNWRAEILEASDGGQGTVKSMLFDELKGPSIWPAGYDGRGLVNASSGDFDKGIGIDEVRRLFAEASQEEDGGFGAGGKGRAAMWAGTGVGLVTEEQSASEIVEEVRKGVSKALEDARARL